jgi:hypothetical protein
VNNLEITPLQAVPSSNIQNITQEGIYNRIIIKNMITNSLRISNLKIEGSIFHCEFDNIDLSGKYTVQFNLVKDKKYNEEYKKIVYDAIPVGSRFTLEKINATNAKGDINIDIKEMRVGDTSNKTKAPQVVVFADSDFKQMNLINDENIPIIFINCSGNFNIIMNNEKEVTNLRRIACPACPKQERPTCPKQECPTYATGSTCAACATCPPPENPTTKLIGTAVAAAVVTVVIYSAILHFRK